MAPGIGEMKTLANGGRGGPRSPNLRTVIPAKAGI
jgi:hypothetical protein